MAAMITYLAIIPLLLPAVLACYWRDCCSYRYYGSKTLYDDVRGDLRDIPRLDGCEPVSVWFMARHGTRNPTIFDMQNMKEAMIIKDAIVKAHGDGRGELCAQDVRNLINWKWNNSIDTTLLQLTKEGYQEFFDLGRRFHEQFYPLLSTVDEYVFRHSNQHRTSMSAKGFTDGLGSDIRTFNVSGPQKIDDVVRMYKQCKRREEEIIKGPQVQREVNKYFETEEFKQMLATVQKRIGVSHKLTPRNATGLYDLCRYSRAFSVNKKGPWCAAFSNHDLEILEYIEDILYYYRNGYGGGPLNIKLGELALKDLFETFSSSNGKKKIIGYFTHDTMLQMIYSALGIYKDYPEISGFERVESRQWRASIHGPFAANFIAVLNTCDNSGALKVQFFVNEFELHLCKGRVCSWEEFNEMFSAYANHTLDFCSLDKMISHS